MRDLGATGRIAPSRMRIGIVLERFYSGQRNGPVTVREGAGGVKKRPARTSLCFVQAGGKGNRGRPRLRVLANRSHDPRRCSWRSGFSVKDARIFQPSCWRAISGTLDDIAQPRPRLRQYDRARTARKPIGSVAATLGIFGPLLFGLAAHRGRDRVLDLHPTIGAAEARLGV
jgi:hypothetical protein